MKYVLATLFSLLSSGAVAQEESPYSAHWSSRDGIISLQQMIAGPTSAVMVGDSITEGFWWNMLGDCRVVNYGYGGAKAQDVANHLAISLQGGAPFYAVVMVGMNDAAVPVPADHLAVYTSSLQSIIDQLRATGAHVILSTITPVEPGKALSVMRDQNFINQMNQVIAAKAAAQGLRLISLANVGTTVDGIHPDRSSYVNLYYQFRNALNAEIGSVGKSCS